MKKLTLTVLLDEVRAQIRETVLGEARSIARSVFDTTVTQEVRRLVDLYITHSFGGARQRFQDALVKVVKEIVAEEFSGSNTIGGFIRETASRAVEDSSTEMTRAAMRSLIQEELRDYFRSR